jgi:hypothetical protein
MNKDPNLEVLLKDVTNPAEREAIITAHTTLQAGGASTLPGALSILLTRLINIVVGMVAAVSPSAQHQKDVADLRKEVAAFRQKDLPMVEEAKETMVQTSLNIRRLRMTYIMVWILSAMVVAAVAAGYGVYHYTALTTQQQKWLAIGKQQGRALNQDEIILLKIGDEMHRHNTDIILADPVQGAFGVKVVGKQQLYRPTYIQDGNQATGLQVYWKVEDTQ